MSSRADRNREVASNLTVADSAVTDEIATGAVLAVPLLLCVAMLTAGAILSRSAGYDISIFLVPYVTTAAAVTFLCLLGFVFLEFVRLAIRLADSPIPTVAQLVRRRLPLLILPAVVFPIFLMGYTGSKIAVPHLIGYSWDSFWADLDLLMFRDDAWRITHSLFGHWTMPAWEWVYTVGWGLALVFAKALTAIYLPPRRVAIFYVAMMGTWLLGGWLFAYAFSAAGPVFVHMFDPTLIERFAPLRTELGATLSAGGAVQETQSYLENAVVSRDAVMGAGISAMPSMHLGAASIYVLLARGTQWIIPALLFWLIIFIGSAHFGYHYWIDAFVAAAIAWFCWKLAELYFEPSSVARGVSRPSAHERPSLIG